MGASTGDMLVDNPDTLEDIFKYCPVNIVTHCEDTPRILENEKLFTEKYGDDLNPTHHPYIRDDISCYLSSSMAIDLAKRNDANLHVLHLTTKKEMEQFQSGAIDNKKITAEVCVHHLRFNEHDYVELGNQIKCNPSIKKEEDRAAVMNALLNDQIDIIATDHAPHTIEDKETTFNDAEFGMIGLESCFGVVNKVLVKENGMSLKSLIEKLTVNPRKIMNLEADLFSVGCKAQITIFDPNEKWVFENKHILSKSSNSPFIGEDLVGRVKYVISKNQFFTL